MDATAEPAMAPMSTPIIAPISAPTPTHKMAIMALTNARSLRPVCRSGFSRWFSA
jgi:hypothetical protein